MKSKSIPISAFFLILILILVSSCTNESAIDPPATQVNSLGDCSGIVVNGSFQSTTVLGDNEYITVKVNVVKIGDYQITTNTVNGYSFSASGNFSTLGIQEVKLKGSGTPEIVQTDKFSISYGGTNCQFNVNVSAKTNSVGNKIIISCGQPHMSFDYYVYAVNGSGNLLWSKLGFGHTVAIANDIVYLNISGNLCAVNINTGVQIWSNETTQGYFNGSVTLSNNILYCSSHNGKIYALDASNGEIKWSFQTEVFSVINSVPTVENNVIYFGAPDSHAYALDLSGNLKWKYKTGATDVRSSPAIANDKVYVGADDGKLYVLNASNGTLVWDFDAGIAGENSPTISNDKVYIQSEKAVFCLNAVNGSEVWRYTLPSTISDWSTPTENNNILYVCGTNNGLQAFNATDGSLLWKNTSFGTSTRESPTVFDGYVYLAAPGGLAAINAASGVTLWIYGKFDSWNVSNVKSFYTSPVVYDIETKTVGYPSDSGNKQ
ncbi:outer membrane protein assembly factor BamB family protein [Flavobacterium maritimum]|uniref:outer membrane protein assembly factor BamB family protein n=1 Tax=Flavobacterium maritimum TaxID=3149042 RepID=UPI0032B43924